MAGQAKRDPATQGRSSGAEILKRQERQAARGRFLAVIAIMMLLRAEARKERSFATATDMATSHERLGALGVSNF